jgi:hypothetical protein
LLRLWPSQPSFPSDGLDGSWQWALDFAIAHKMQFGRDLVFTYGPYADITSLLYNPATRVLTMSAVALIAAAFALPLAALARPAALLCTAAVLPLVYSNDAFAFVLPLPALLLCAKAARGHAPRLLPFAVLLQAPAIALLPLIKLSYLPVTLIGAVAIAGLLWLAARRRLAVGFGALVCLSVPALWCASGQMIGNVLPFFINGSVIIAGYGAALAFFGPFSEFAWALAIAGLILALLVWGARGLPRRAALLLVLAIAGMIFIALKAGFVRQDAGHAPAAVGAAALALLVLSAWLPALPASLAAFAGVLILTGPLNAFGGPGGLGPAITGLERELRGTRLLLFEPAEFAEAYKRAVAGIAHLPWHPPGTSDIYANLQSNLLASGLAWSPRPVFQSYSAYTPSLARMNAQHLTGAGAPDNVFFRPEPIDGHFPALEDGASWPALLSLYLPAGYEPDKDLLWLKRDHAASIAAPGPAVMAGRARLDQTISLPDAPALWATIDVTPSLAGRVAGILAKTPLLDLVVKLSNGESKDYGFVPGMGPAGFLISPLVMSSWDFIHLRQRRGGRYPDPPRVVSFTLDAGAQSHWVWQRKYRFSVAPIAFSALQTPALPGLPKPASRAMPQVVARPTCYLDEANGSPIPDAPVMIGSSLTVDGWGAFDVQAGVAADSAELGFVNAAGQAWSVPALLRSRAGVGLYFHHPALLNLHLLASADPSGLPPGPYRVQIFLARAGQTIACPTRLSIIVPPG